jgi:phage/plasmid primase-like uncharacterized protein
MIAAGVVEQAKAVPVESVIEARGIRLRRSGAERFGPCPICGGTDRFAININKQVFNCRVCDVGGDVIRLIEFLDGVTFREACARLTAGELFDGGFRRHLDLGGHHQRVERERNEGAERIERAAAIWDEAKLITGTAGEDYLRERRILIDDVPECGGLRWHANCLWGSSTAPCIVARFTDLITNEPQGIWRRPVSGEKPKAYGPMAGCVIRLWPDEEVTQGLVIGEGVETVLAASRIIHRNALLRPAWATGGTGNLTKIPVLAGIDALTILVDHDANNAGQRAAEECAQRWRYAGREVIQLIPNETGVDFNDMVRRS